MDNIKVRKALSPKALGELSARKLVAIWDKIDDERRPLCDTIIAIGLGHIPIQTLFKDYLHFTPVKADKELSDQQAAICAECERRYGHDGLFYARYIR